MTELRGCEQLGGVVIAFETAFPHNRFHGIDESKPGGRNGLKHPFRKTVFGNCGFAVNLRLCDWRTTGKGRVK